MCALVRAARNEKEDLPVKRTSATLLLSLALFLLFQTGLVFSEDAKPEAKPDPSGANTGNLDVLGVEKPKDVETNVSALATFVTSIGDAVGKNRIAINMMWVL